MEPANIPCGWGSHITPQPLLMSSRQLMAAVGGRVSLILLFLTPHSSLPPTLVRNALARKGNHCEGKTTKDNKIES